MEEGGLLLDEVGRRAGIRRQRSPESTGAMVAAQHRSACVYTRIGRRRREHRGRAGRPRRADEGDRTWAGAVRAGRHADPAAECAGLLVRRSRRMQCLPPAGSARFASLPSPRLTHPVRRRHLGAAQHGGGLSSAIQ
jgi:hypothetical protein